MITPQLNKQLHALITKLSMMEHKPYLVESFTHGRSSSSKDLTNFECIELIKHLKMLQNLKNVDATQEATHVSHAMPPIKKQTPYEQGDAMRKKIIALAHQINWKTTHPRSGKEIADMKRINEWCKTHGYLHKELNHYTVTELPVLVTQFQNMYNSYLKTTIIS